MDQNQTAEKNSAHGTPSWLVAWLDASHRNPTPYFGGQNLESFALGASLAQPAISRPTAGPARVRACARVNEKSVLAIKLGPKAGCSLEALNFHIPSRVFLYRGREFPGLQLNHGEPGSMASYQRYSRGNAPFLPSKITYPIENHRVKKA